MEVKTVIMHFKEEIAIEGKPFYKHTATARVQAYAPNALMAAACVVSEIADEIGYPTANYGIREEKVTQREDGLYTVTWVSHTTPD